MAKKINVKWDRVYGPDLDPENAERRKINLNIASSQIFKKFCKVAGIPETKRQSSKWKNGKGVAFKTFTGVVSPAFPQYLQDSV